MIDDETGLAVLTEAILTFIENGRVVIYDDIYQKFIDKCGSIERLDYVLDVMVVGRLLRRTVFYDARTKENT